MKKAFDRIAIGNKIRKLRKDQKMTLEQFASGICSTGKMSNIENGLTDIQRSDLLLIAKKLNISYEEIINLHAENHQKIYSSIDDLEEFISLGMGQEALILLEKIREEFANDINKDSSIKMKLLYIKGLSLLILEKDYNATVLFYRILTIPSVSKNDVISRAKANHKLGELYAKNLQHRMAIEHLESGVNELLTNKVEVPWRFYYNLCSLYMYSRQFDKAAIYLSFIRPKNPQLQYVDALLCLFLNNNQEGMDKLQSSRDAFIEMNDSEMLVKSIMAILYFTSFSPTKYNDRIKNAIYLLENDLLSKQYNNDAPKELIVITMHSVISKTIQSSNISKAEKYLDLLFAFEERHSYMKYRYISLLLRASIMKRLKPKPLEDLAQILIEAESLMKENSIHNMHRANVLYERALISDETHTLSFQALNMINSYSDLDTFDSIHLEHFLPSILPIY